MLCFDLGIDPDSFAYSSKLDVFTYELVQHYERHSKLSTLVEALQEARPHATWPTPEDKITLPKQSYEAILRPLLLAYFSRDELAIIALDLFPTIELPPFFGYLKIPTVSLLIRKAEQEGLLSNLLLYIQRERPHLNLLTQKQDLLAGLAKVQEQRQRIVVMTVDKGLLETMLDVLDRQEAKLLAEILGNDSEAQADKANHTTVIGSVTGAVHTGSGNIFVEAEFETSDSEQGSQRDDEPLGDFPTFATAIARIQTVDSSLPIGLYVIEAGIRQQLTEGFTNQLFTLPTQENEILFHISVHAEDIALESPRLQPFLYRQDQETPLVEFKLRPTKLGKKRIWVEFLYQNHWLAQIELNVTVTQLVAESIEQS